MPSITMSAEIRGIEIELEVEGDVSGGGSNYYGSDEPEWIEVDITDVTCANTGKPISKRLEKALAKIGFFSDAEDSLIYAAE